MRSAAALDDSVVAQLHEDCLQELARDVFLFRDLRIDSGHHMATDIAVAYNVA